MLQKALVLVFAVASIASCVGCGQTQSHYVYATVSTANQVFAYREDPNSGVLTELSGSPYPAGDGASSVVAHPSGKYLYVANPGQLENDISLFTIASNGVLTEKLPRTFIGVNASQPTFLAMDPAGAFLYVANTKSNNISVFSIDSSGALTQLTSSPTAINGSPLNMQLTPSGSYLYVTTSGGQPGTSNGSIFAFSVSAGVLTSLISPPQNPASTSGINPNGLAIDPSGSYLYAANTGSGSISIFAIGATGTPPGSLSQIPGSPLAVNYLAPVSLSFDPKGSYLYVANQGSNNVAVYSISSTGLPSLFTGSTTNNGTTSTGAFFTEGNPSYLASDPNGNYLFVGNQGGSTGIQAFTASGGVLTDIYTYRVGNTPTSITVVK